MHTPSSLIASITLIAFLQTQIASVWALPVAIPEQAHTHTPTLLYLGKDPYTQALLRLQYDEINNTLEWQLLNNGLVLTSQSHALPGATESVDAAVIYGGDLIIVAGRSSNQNWFLRALNSQGEFQWQRSGEGRVYDLAFSEDGKSLYAVGAVKKQPLLLVISTQNGVGEFHSGLNKAKSDQGAVSNKQVIAIGNRLIILAHYREIDGRLQYSKWQAEANLVNGTKRWSKAPGFCADCDRTGVISVALKNDGVPGRFYSIWSDQLGLHVEQKDYDKGVSLAAKTVVIPSGAMHWESVLKLAGSDFVALSRTPANPRQLVVTDNGCQLRLQQSDLPEPVAFGFCQNLNALRIRRHDMNEKVNESDMTQPTPTSPSNEFPHPEGLANRVINDWIGALVGILGGGTIVTGILLFIHDRWANYKKRVAQAKEIEKGRRGAEKLFLGHLEQHKPFFDFESSMSINYQLPDLPSRSEGAENLLTLPHPMQVIHKLKEFGDKKKADLWLFKNKELIDATDEFDFTPLHYLVLDKTLDQGAKYDLGILLLKHGANPNQRPYNNLTPIELVATDDSNRKLFDIFKSNMTPEEILHILDNTDEEQVHTWLKNNPGIFNTRDDAGNTFLHYLTDSTLVEPYRLMRYKQLEFARTALQYKADVSARSFSGYTPLEFAVVNNDAELFNILLPWKIDFDFEEISRLLHLSAKASDPRILRSILSRGLHKGIRFVPKIKYCFLLEYFRKIDEQTIQNERGQTLLHEAVISCNNQVVKEILNSHPHVLYIPVDTTDDNGNTALHLAALTGNSEAVDFLLGESATVNARNKAGDTALHLAAQKRDNIPVVAKLVRSDRSCRRSRNLSMKTPLDIACEQNNHHYIHNEDGRADTCDDLLVEPDWTEPNLHDETLAFMARNGCSSAIEAMGRQRLEQYIDERVDDSTPLELALNNGHYATAEVLIELGATKKLRNINISVENDDGTTPLHWAIKSGNLDIAMHLAQKETVNYHADKFGNTPLHYLAGLFFDDLTQDEEQLMEQLINQLTIDVHQINAVNADGNSPLHLAVRNGVYSLAIALINKGADLKQTNNDGYTLLHHSALNDDVELTKLLLESGVNPLFLDKDGNTPIDIASNRDILQLLQKFMNR